jgi:hypothetical protein
MTYCFFERICFNLSDDAILFKYKLFFHISKTSLQHNLSQIEEVLADYWKYYIHIGTKREWKKGRKTNANKQNPYYKNELMIDSSEFKISGSRTCSRKSDDWSFKVNGKGLKYHIVSDYNNIFRMLSYGRKPKEFDGFWLCVNSSWFNRHFAGANMLGDNHYQIATEFLPDINFDCNPGEKLKGKKPTYVSEERLQAREQLESEMLEKSIHISQMRGSVDQQFAILIRMFDCVKSVFRRDETSLTNTLLIGCGISNMKNGEMYHID